MVQLYSRLPYAPLPPPDHLRRAQRAEACAGPSWARKPTRHTPQCLALGMVSAIGTLISWVVGGFNVAVCLGFPLTAV